MHMSVTYASQHNATAQIAEVVASVRRQPDDERSTSTVDVRAVENVDEVEDHDTLILGSAIYNGRWLPSARHFARGWLSPACVRLGGRDLGLSSVLTRRVPDRLSPWAPSDGMTEIAATRADMVRRARGGAACST